MRALRAAVALAALVTASWGAAATSGASTPATSPCAVPIEDRAAEVVPAEVADFAAGAPVLGEGSLWLLVNRPELRPTFSVEDDRWELRKVVWYRLVPGTIAIEARRVGRRGRTTAEIDQDGYGATGFRPSSLELPRSGCWRVHATLEGSTVTFWARVPAGAAGICRDLAGQLDDARSFGDTGLVGVLEDELDARECDDVSPARRGPRTPG